MLRPLAQYGPWKRTFPNVACGAKRGFSYFAHALQSSTADQQLTGFAESDRRLLVAASSSDETSDTHWYRADVDQLFAQTARSVGVEIREQAELVEAVSMSGRWKLRWTQLGRNDVETVSSPCVIDASGSSGVIGRTLGLDHRTDSLRTASQATFAHFRNVPRWESLLNAESIDTGDYPFPCDDAALHHLFQHGWMWVLRFDNGVTSVGLCESLSEPHDRSTRKPSRSNRCNWDATLSRYPAVAKHLRAAELADPGALMVSTERMQRLWGVTAGQGWIMLPNTAGFIDPLFSTGIAHSLLGVERVAAMWKEGHLVNADESPRRQYDELLQAEFDIIDRLVALAYQAMSLEPRCALPVSMLYFAAITISERQPSVELNDARSAMLHATNPQVLEAVTAVEQSLPELANRATCDPAVHEDAPS